jgi:hypothetical protein
MNWFEDETKIRAIKRIDIVPEIHERYGNRSIY